MQITRLRLMGFKSFVEPTELLIERGLTGVVGPNGCGKSNLLEALRWVMGETSPKSMRAAARADVIFAGTTTRPASYGGTSASRRTGAPSRLIDFSGAAGRFGKKSHMTTS
jgi:chromosome segregation ATPase